MAKPEGTKERAKFKERRWEKIKKAVAILGGASIITFAIMLLSPQKSEAAEEFYCSDGTAIANLTPDEVCDGVSLFSMEGKRNSNGDRCMLEFSSYAFCLMWNWSHGIVALGIVIAAFLWGAATLLFSKQFKGIGIALAVAVVLWIGPRFASETFQAESLQSVMKEEGKAVGLVSVSHQLQEKNEKKEAEKKKSRLE